MAAIIETVGRPGTFDAGESFFDSVSREGTFTTSIWITENPDRPGTFMEYTPFGVYENPLTADRVATRRHELLNSNMTTLGAFDGVTGASLSETANATLKRGGSMSATDVEQGVDWLTQRFHAIIDVDGYGQWGLGVFVASVPQEDWSGDTRRWSSIELLDVASVLDEATLEDAYALAAGAVVTDAIKALIELTGESSAAVTDSTKTLSTAKVFDDPEQSVLGIINALANSIGYFALATDRDGAFRVQPYVKPGDRPVRWEFIDGETCTYRPDLSLTRDLYHVPNHVRAYTQGTPDTAGLVVNVYNDNSDSPFSRANRGRTITKRVQADATDADALLTIAQRALIEATTPSTTIMIDALPVPASVNDAVRFRRIPAGIDARCVVSKIEHGAGHTALARFTLTEVVEV